MVVKEKHLVGELKGFPIEIAQKIMDYRKEQYGDSDIKLIQEDIADNLCFEETEEGYDFWYYVIMLKEFDRFLEK